MSNTGLKGELCSDFNMIEVLKKITLGLAIINSRLTARGSAPQNCQKVHLMLLNGPFFVSMRVKG